MTRFVALLVLFASPLSAVAELELRISKTTNDGIPIYLANIPGGANGIIEANLKRSGRFTIVNRSKIKNLPPYGKPLNGGVYTDIADYIVRGLIRTVSSDFSFQMLMGIIRLKYLKHPI